MKARYILVVLPLVVGLAFAQTDTAGTGGQGGLIFEAGGSARSLAMGQAYAALADEGEAVLYNPAGLGQIHTAKLGLLGGSLYAGTYQSVIAYNMPWASYGTFGLAFVGTFGALEETTAPDGSPTSAPGGMANAGFMISYAKKFSSFSVGLAPKLLFGVLSDKQAIGFDADLGFMFYPVSFFPTLPYNMVSLGVSAKNLLGTTLRYSEEDTFSPANPRIVRAGLGIRLLDNRVVLGSDISYMLDGSGNFGWYEGLEVSPAKPLAIRLGANHKFFSAGLGIKTELTRSVGLAVDYAFMMHYQSGFMLQPVHKVSLNLDLKNVAGIWIESRPATLTSPADYAEIFVHGAAQFKGRHKRWVFEIQDAGGNTVYHWMRDVYGDERDELPPKLTWNGVNNIRGGQVDKGSYYYRLTIVDKLGDQIVYEGFLVKVDWKGIRR